MSTRPAQLVPVQDYQAARLTEALAGLDWCDWHPDFVAHQARTWGATDTEAWAIVHQLRGHRAAA